MEKQKNKKLKRIIISILVLVLLIVISFFTYVLWFGYGQEIFGIVWFG